MNAAYVVSFRLLLAGTLLLAGPVLRADVLEQTFAAPNGLTVSVKTIAPYAQPADLQIICVFKHRAGGDTYIEAMRDLDNRLGGLLSSVRNRGEFVGELGETLLLEPPEGTVATPKLLVIGLGEEQALSLETLNTVGRVAASEAIHLKARSVSFAPTIRDQGNATIGVGAGDAAVVENVLLTYDTNRRLQQEHWAEPLNVESWTIDAGPTFYQDAAEKVGQGVQTAARAIEKRNSAPYSTTK